MSWDASLNVVSDGHSYQIFEQNYTHNCNRMISTVLEESGYDNLEEHWLIGHMGKSWFKLLNGMNGEDGEKFLNMILFGLTKDPARFREMNPANGWGSYDQLINVLEKMRDASKENHSAIWSVSG